MNALSKWYNRETRFVSFFNVLEADNAFLKFFINSETLKSAAVLLSSCLHLYPIPVCFSLSIYLNFTLKAALVLPFHDFLSIFVYKIAPWLLSLLVQGAFVSSSVYSQAEVPRPDFPVLPVPPRCSGIAHCPRERGVGLVLWCPWWPRPAGGIWI